MLGRRTALTLLATLLALGLAYWASTYFMAYTDDAYVDSDLIQVAPLVDGPVVGVHVTDNHFVAKGQPLLTIDPTPYRIKVRNAQAQLDEAKGQMISLEDNLDKTKAQRQEKASALDLAQVTQRRYSELMARQVVAAQAYDQRTEEFRAAQADFDAAHAQYVQSQQSLTVQQSLIDLAGYYLDKCVLLSPANGWVTALSTQPGDYVKTGAPVIGLVDDDAWRVEANYRECLVRHMQPGQEVFVYLDGHPWRLFKGVVQGVRRGVARSPTPEKLLPYVEPTINWIRLARRLPVRVQLQDLPRDVVLRKGADARTLVLYAQAANATPVR